MCIWHDFKSKVGIISLDLRNFGKEKCPTDNNNAPLGRSILSILLCKRSVSSRMCAAAASIRVRVSMKMLRTAVRLLRNSSSAADDDDDDREGSTGPKNVCRGAQVALQLLLGDTGEPLLMLPPEPPMAESVVTSKDLIRWRSPRRRSARNCSKVTAAAISSTAFNSCRDRNVTEISRGLLLIS